MVSAISLILIPYYVPTYSTIFLQFLSGYTRIVHPQRAADKRNPLNDINSLDPALDFISDIVLIRRPQLSIHGSMKLVKHSRRKLALCQSGVHQGALLQLQLRVHSLRQISLFLMRQAISHLSYDPDDRKTRGYVVVVVTPNMGATATP